MHAPMHADQLANIAELQLSAHGYLIKYSGYYGIMLLTPSSLWLLILSIGSPPFLPHPFPSPLSWVELMTSPLPVYMCITAYALSFFWVVDNR